MLHSFSMQTAEYVFVLRKRETEQKATKKTLLGVLKLQEQRQSLYK